MNQQKKIFEKPWKKKGKEELLKSYRKIITILLYIFVNEFTYTQIITLVDACVKYHIGISVSLCAEWVDHVYFYIFEQVVLCTLTQTGLLLHAQNAIESGVEKVLEKWGAQIL